MCCKNSSDISLLPAQLHELRTVSGGDDRPQHEDRLQQDEEAAAARQDGRRPQGHDTHHRRERRDSGTAFHHVRCSRHHRP